MAKKANNKYMITVEYHHNNSGGGWWLKDEHWLALEKAGWKVEWVKDDKDKFRRDSTDRFLGALATRASKQFLTPREAMVEFEKVTGMSVCEEGCNCCGPPHCFEWGEGESFRYASGESCATYLYPEESTAATSLRSALDELKKTKAKLAREKAKNRKANRKPRQPNPKPKKA